MNADLVMSCNRVLGALLNGGYQGLVLTVVVWLGLKLVPGANAATRHLVWLATLMLVAALPVVHMVSPRSDAKAYSNSLASGGANLPQANGFAKESEEDFLPLAGVDFDFWAVTASSNPSLSENSGRSMSQNRAQNAENDDAPGSASRTGSIGSLRVAESPSEKPASGTILGTGRFLSAMPWNWRVAISDRTSVGLIALWAALAIWRLGKLAWQYRQLCSLKRRGTFAPERLCKVFETLSGELGMRRKTLLLTSDESAAPVAIGFWRPVVLFPARLLDGSEALRFEQVMRHELAHISRGDDWTNLIQQTVKAVLFFHPAIGWVSRRLAIEREIACDDHVLAATRTPRAYALLLTEFAGQMQCRESTAALAAWSHKNQLEERITMILNPNRNNSPRLARIRAGLLTATAAAVALLVLQAGPRLALAAEQQPKADPANVQVIHDSQDSAAVSTGAESTLETTLEAKSDALIEFLDVPDAPPEPPGNSDDSEPRSKPQPAKLIAPKPAPAANAFPAPARVATAPAAPSVATASSGTAIAQPIPVAAPRSRRSDDSIERRLERLEKMVESLLARDKGGKSRADAEHNLNIDVKIPKFDFSHDQFAKLAEDHAKLAGKMHKLGPNEEELARITERAAKDAARGARNIERAVKELELKRIEDGHHAKSLEEHHIHAADARSSTKDALRKQRQTLQAQHKALEKQMEALERKIQRLEEEQEKAEEPREDRDKKMKQTERKGGPATSENADRKEKQNARP